MAPASVSSAATATASTAAAGAVLFMSPLRENTNTDAVPSLPMSHRFTLAGTSDAELSALFPKKMASNTADDLKFFVLFAVSGIVVLAAIFFMAKFKASTTKNNKKQTETPDFLSPTTSKKLNNLFVSVERILSVDKPKDDESPSNRTESTGDMTEVKHPVRDMHTGPAETEEEGGHHGCCPSPIKIDFAGKLSKKKPGRKNDADLETIGSVKTISNKAKLGNYEVTFRSPFKKGVGIRTPLKSKKMD